MVNFHLKWKGLLTDVYTITVDSNNQLNLVALIVVNSGQCVENWNFTLSCNCFYVDNYSLLFIILTLFVLSFFNVFSFFTFDLVFAIYTWNKKSNQNYRAVEVQVNICWTKKLLAFFNYLFAISWSFKNLCLFFSNSRDWTEYCES